MDKKRISVKNLLCFILTVILVCSAKYISDNYYQFMLIQGKSMEPAYHNLQLVILDKRKEEYEYNDVIVFWNDSLNNYLVKRIVACPGDRVCIAEGTLYINGSISFYCKDVKIDFAGIAENELTLSLDDYFVLGDNIEESKDSRYKEVGIVKQNTILGKIMK